MRPDFVTQSLRTIALALGLVVPAVPAAAESLTDALASAYLNSDLLAQQQALLRVADEDVAGAVAALRPIVNYSASASEVTPEPPTGSFSGSLALSVELLLYDFGGSQLAVEQVKQTVLATRAALVEVEQQVLLRAVAAFVGVRQAEALVALNEANVRLITQELRASQDRFEVGEVTRTDVSLAEAQLAAGRAGLAAEQGALVQAREEYRAAVGRFPGALTAPRGTPSIPATLDAAKAIARERHPDITEAQFNVSAAEIGVARAETALYPSLRGTGSASIDQDGDSSASIGITLSGPIYQGGALASSIRQVAAQRDATRSGLLSTVLAVEQNVGNAWANLAVAVATLEARDREVAAAQLALEGLREELRLGARTTLDVLDQEQELLDARTARINAENDRVLAVYSLLDAMGLLTVDNLGLSVPVFDPEAYYNTVRSAPTVRVSPEGQRLDRVLRAIGREE
ncbi:MAG: TolC family outer membrane protein [Paracoccaceae bacterium]|nr:TolC family outer membrane protein [Paracoccaceae bacterium]